MKKDLIILSFFTFILLPLNLNYSQIITAGIGNWSAAASWVGGNIPDSTSDVIIASGHTITIDDANAVCKNITFQDTLGFLAMGSSSSVMSVYGNFTLVSSSSYKSFTAWPDGAKIKFKGDAVQTLSRVEYDWQVLLHSMKWILINGAEW